VDLWVKGRSYVGMKNRKGLGSLYVVNMRSSVEIGVVSVHQKKERCCSSQSVQVVTIGFASLL